MLLYSSNKFNRRLMFMTSGIKHRFKQNYDSEYIVLRQRGFSTDSPPEMVIMCLFLSNSRDKKWDVLRFVSHSTFHIFGISLKMGNLSNLATEISFSGISLSIVINEDATSLSVTGSSG